MSVPPRSKKVKKMNLHYNFFGPGVRATKQPWVQNNLIPGEQP